ncbi:NADH-quinone oxidoreductase subunit K [Paenibacillus sp. TRM 82003]|uniref:NADH-quinone oxidoreductase subunit K n=1 Tax=Kineococcus sp. TRM81007 TaxID=2925831 RepID=UPI001F586B95|nr:NADH-quinone oxidoreductase subunit K [Kineococcus sp. TRM81007]MCI2238317.1 NADH-quinone oxidoreductase subunit K [Kineococcus sp. TRM81007]MCI3924011.1 NADH-quinone oxidoreductase subunit K [Paenibacillus sp. TRM 82003]
MSPTVVLTVTVAGLVAVGVYLLTSRHLSRVVLGVVVMSNGVNLLLIAAAGPAGPAPIAGPGGAVPEEELASAADPLPQAFVLTAIVITFAVTAFGLALSYRLGRLEDDDVVHDAGPHRRTRGEPAGAAGPGDPDRDERHERAGGAPR